MKITRLGPTRPLVSLTGLLSGGDAGPAGQVPTSIGSNGAIAWGSNVSLITVNGTTKVLGPYVNFANGSNTTVTVDMVGAVASNTIRIHATGGAASFGSNSNAVGEANAPGASSDSSRADHVHLGVRTISHASNTFAGPITLTTSGLLGITSPTPGTLNFSSTGSAGGGGGGVTVSDEGSPLSTTATTLDFVGAGVTASGTGATKTITISGGSSGSDPVNELFGTPTTAFEFDTSSLTGLTALGTPDTENANTTVPGHYYARIAGAGAYAWVGRYLAPPSAPWTAVTKVRAMPLVNYNAACLFLGVGTPGNMDVLSTDHDSSRKVTINRVTPGAFGSSITSATVELPQPAYLAIIVNSSTDVDYLYSRDGYIWRTLLVARNPGITIGSVGIAVKSESGGEITGAFDYLRIWNTAKVFPGGS